MEVERTAPQVARYTLTWAEASERAMKIPPGRIYGIPRGGRFVEAFMVGMSPGRWTAAANPEEADFFVDDIIDSGATAKRYYALYGKETLALVRSQEGLGWIDFPWDRGTAEQSGPTDAVVRLLQFVGENPRRDGLLDTPSRVVRALAELTAGYHEDPAAILARCFDVDYTEMVVLRGIEFTSLCEHHMLPFSGVAAVAYVPGRKIVGISKLARLVQCFARRLQVQERMTHEIALAIETHLQPTGVGVVVKAHHQCMGCRGVKQPQAEMITSCLRGVMLDKSEARSELIGLL